MDAKTHLTDLEFWTALRACGGNYAQTRRYIKDKYGRDVTRQGIYQRANRHKDLLDDIREEAVDQAEEVLVKLLQSKNEAIRHKVAIDILKHQGKHRGWSEKVQIDLSGNMGVTWTEVRVNKENEPSDSDGDGE